jgi:hypothetical protein
MVDWFNSQLPPMAKAFASYVPKCPSVDPHTKELIEHLKTVAGGVAIKKAEIKAIAGEVVKKDLKKGKVFVQEGKGVNFAERQHDNEIDLLPPADGDIHFEVRTPCT